MANFLTISAVVFFANHARRDFTHFDGDGLVNHALLFRVITHFNEARGGKILAERVANKTVVGEDAAQVVMTLKNNTEKVKSFTFKPIGRIPDVVDGIHYWKIIIRTKHLQPHALIEADGQQVRRNAKAQAIVLAVFVF